MIHCANCDQILTLIEAKCNYTNIETNEKICSNCYDEVGTQ